MNKKENDRKTILIVDDEETLTWSISKNLTMNKQYKVICANSSEEALQILEKTSNINLIVSDIRMAGKSGLELLDEVKEHCPQIGFIAMTAYGSDDDKRKAREKGALRYIEKPFGIEAMIQVIGEVLGEMGLLVQPQAPLTEQIEKPVSMSAASVSEVLSKYSQDIKEIIFVKLNALQGDVVFQVGINLAPASQKDLISSGLVKQAGEVCHKLTFGKLELIMISTEKHYVLLHCLTDKQLFLYSLIERELGLGKALYLMEHLTLKIAGALKIKAAGRQANEI